MRFQEEKEKSSFGDLKIAELSKKIKDAEQQKKILLDLRAGYSEDSDEYQQYTNEIVKQNFILQKKSQLQQMIEKRNEIFDLISKTGNIDEMKKQA